MSIGLGILVSTVLALAAWQIDKRNAWRKAGKAALWMVALAVLIAAGTWGWLLWEDRSFKEERAREVAKVREPNGLLYWDLSIGMSKSEVRYLKGDPTETKEATPNGASESWTYRFGNDPNTMDYDIYWDKSGNRIVALICQGPDASNCEKVEGLGHGSSEADVRKTLGKPTEDSPPNEKGLKRLAYGTGKERLLIFLSRGQVDSIALTLKVLDEK